MKNINKLNNLHIYVTKQQNKEIADLINISHINFNYILAKKQIIVIAIAYLIDKLKKEGLFNILTDKLFEDTLRKKNIRIHIKIPSSQNRELENFKHIAFTDFNKRIYKDSLINLAISDFITNIKTVDDLKRILERYLII
jgi:hypothetical protein